MEYSNGTQDVYKNIEDYNPGKKRKILPVFDDMIADMINNKKLNPVVTEKTTPNEYSDYFIDEMAKI